VAKGAWELTSGNGDGSAGTKIQVGRQNLNDGAVGVKVQVDGRPVAPRSTLLDLGPLFGRSEDLAAISEALKDPGKPARLILSGEPGIGKTHLANAYGADKRTCYPGGMFFVAFNDDPALGLAKLTVPLAEETIADRATRMLRGIEEPTLLIYDDVPSERELIPWLPPAGLPVHVLVTTTSSDWPRRHTVHSVQPLDPKDARALIEGVAGREVGEKYGEELARHAAGIVVRLRFDCDYVEFELRHGRKPLFTPLLDSGTESSFARAFALLAPDGQLCLRVAALFNHGHVPQADLERRLASHGWNETRRQQALDAVLDRRLLTRANDVLRMHGLVAQFVRALQTPAVPEPILARHREVFVKTARAFEINPASTELREQLAAYPSLVEEWRAIGLRIGLDSCLSIAIALAEDGRFEEALGWSKEAAAIAEDDGSNGRVDHSSVGLALHQVGYCMKGLRQYTEAKSWYERAVAAEGRGNANGRVDQVRLGKSLGEVGHCLSNLGEYAESMSWYNRAITATEKGDLLGRPDRQSLGQHFHGLGDCLCGLGQHAEAIPWFKRAAEAKQGGDVHGRVDHESLGCSMHKVGYCLYETDEMRDAIPWFQRAVAEDEQGDVHGRIDYENLAASLYETGYCLLGLGEYNEARSWFERSVVAREKGDVHGRVHNAELGESLGQVGFCLWSLRQQAEAKIWFERAITVAEKGDIFGRINHTSVGTGLHNMACWLWEFGQHAEARSCLDRAIAERRKGDVHGRVNHEGLGGSLRLVGYWLARAGQHEDARPWFEQAITAKEKGDIRGRVDHGSLARSLLELGSCLSSLGQHDEARNRVERAAKAAARDAVEARGRPDGHGRIHHEGLGK
jgi:tetratricopeptide (TPR) repeat protein